MVATGQKRYGRKKSASGCNAISPDFLTSQYKLDFPPPVLPTTKAKRKGPVLPTTRAKRKGPAWTALTKSQQTITQMNPFHSLYHPDESEEGLQYLDDTTEVHQESPKQAKRQKIDHDDTPTQPVRAKSARNTAAAKENDQSVKVARREHQTITQMNPFHPLYHPDEIEEGLQYLDDMTDVHQESPRQAKRQKIDHDDTPSQSVRERSTRSTTAAKTTEKSVKAVRREHQALTQDSSYQQKNDKISNLGMMPPPPKTPHSRRIEIPSSQSPLDSPLSTRSGRNLKLDVTRSPLKEKSLNFASRPPLSATGVDGGARMREIPDSMEDEEEKDSGASSHCISTLKTQTSVTSDHGEFAIPFLPTSATSRKNVSASFAKTETHIQSSTQAQPSPDDHSVSRKYRKKVEILDSEAEDDSDEDVPLSHHSKNSLQPHRNISNPTAPDPEILVPSVSARTSRFLTTPLRNHSSPILPQSQNHPQPQPTIDVPSSQPEFDPPTSTSPKPNLQSSPPHRTPATSSASQHPHRKSARSTQVATQPGLLTESQYENGWRSYHPTSSHSHHHSNPPPPSSSALQPLSSPQIPSLQHQHPREDNPTPTQPFPLPTPSRRKPPVPPSQATTVDTTQASEILSSPPPSPAPPVLSSSPLLSGRRGGWSQLGGNGGGSGGEKGYEWDGRVMTDSQLLPASLMEDSLDVGGSEFELE